MKINLEMVLFAGNSTLDLWTGACLSELSQWMNLGNKRFLYLKKNNLWNKDLGFIIYEMTGPAEYPAKLDEKRPHKSTSLRNSEHLEQEHLFLFYKFSETEKLESEETNH